MVGCGGVGLVVRDLEVEEQAQLQPPEKATVPSE